MSLCLRHWKRSESGYIWILWQLRQVWVAAFHDWEIVAFPDYGTSSCLLALAMFSLSVCRLQLAGFVVLIWRMDGILCGAPPSRCGYQQECGASTITTTRNVTNSYFNRARLLSQWHARLALLKTFGARLFTDVHGATDQE